MILWPGIRRIKEREENQTYTSIRGKYALELVYIPVDIRMEKKSFPLFSSDIRPKDRAEELYSYDRNRNDSVSNACLPQHQTTKLKQNARGHRILFNIDQSVCISHTAVCLCAKKNVFFLFHYQPV